MNKLSRNSSCNAAVQIREGSEMVRSQMSRRVRKFERLVFLFAGLLPLAVQSQEFPPAAAPSTALPPVVRVAPPGAVQSAMVYVYPDKGQSAEQSDRDRYECHLWAVRQTGFDPSAPQLAPRERVQVVAGGPPPGATAAAGA